MIHNVKSLEKSAWMIIPSLVSGCVLSLGHLFLNATTDPKQEKLGLPRHILQENFGFHGNPNYVCKKIHMQAIHLHISKCQIAAELEAMVVVYFRDIVQAMQRILQPILSVHSLITAKILLTPRGLI